MGKRDLMVAIYCRLSRDDATDTESNSIGNQRDQLHRYANEHGFITYSEYIDDGISGTTFERDGFKRMIADIEADKIGIILCKDLSRFGRNNAVVAYYTEIYLPSHDVRLICVNDSIDTSMGDNEILPFKSVINEFYARDTSKKVRSAKRTQALRGEYYAGAAPYGYVKDPKDKHKLVIDEEAAIVVRRMFQMAADGQGVHQIARQLHAERALIPAAYKSMKLGKKANRFSEEYPYDWQTTTVKRILVSRVYIGDMCNHKQTCKSYKIRKTVYIPEEDWITVVGTHAPIVDKGTFERVQKLVKYRTRVNTANVPNIFAGLLVCADCNSFLSFHAPKAGTGTKEGQYSCNKYRHSAASADGRRSCTYHYTPYASLYDIVLGRLNHLFATNLSVERIVKRIKETDVAASATQKKLEKMKRREGELRQIIQKIVEQHALGEIAKITFADLYGKYLAEQETLLVDISRIEAVTAAADREVENANLFVGLVRKYTVIEELTREVLLDTIEKIVIHEAVGASRWKPREQRIDIYYRFVGHLPNGIGLE